MNTEQTSKNIFMFTHASIRLINEHATHLDNMFSFAQTTYEDIYKERKN